MNVAALDLSLSATGVALANGETTVLIPRETGMGRLAWLRDNVWDKVAAADLVVIEGYSYGSKGSATVDIGELGGIIRFMLWERGCTYVEVAPSLLKKFATGIGNKKKEAVLVAAVRAGYGGDENNEADAWWLRQMVLYHLGVPEVPITVYRTESVRKVAWPALLADGVPATSEAT